MNSISIDNKNLNDINSVRETADRLASEKLGDAACLSWHDLETGMNSPNDSNICGDTSDVGQYARSLGAELEVDVNGKYKLYYRNVKDFPFYGKKAPRLQVEDVDQYFA